MWARNSRRGGRKPPRCCGRMCPHITGFCGKGGEGGMNKECGPSGDEGSSDGLTQRFRGSLGLDSDIAEHIVPTIIWCYEGQQIH